MDKLLKYRSIMRESADYLKMQDLKQGYCYKIYARNAYVGVWLEKQKVFMISRYKIGKNPYLANEYHWDIKDEEEVFCGTAKPLELIEKFPFKLKEDYEDNEEQEILNYLDQLEMKNPITSGIETPELRKQSAIKFEQRISGNRSPETRRMVKQARELGIRVRDLELIKKINRVSAEFVQNVGRDATFDELVKRMDRPEDDVKKLLEIKAKFSL